MSEPKEIDFDLKLLHESYKKRINELMQYVNQQKCFQSNAFVQASDHCIQLGYPRKSEDRNIIVVIPYQQEHPNCDADEGRPDWRKLLCHWLAVTGYKKLWPTAKRILDDQF